MSRNFDILGDIVDEIALEGLDGITFKSLLIRLRHRQGFALPIDEYSKKYFWSIVCKIADVKFFVISQEREDIVVPIEDQKNLDAAVDLLYNLYPFKLVSTDDEVGSCVEFETRINVTESVRNMDLPEVEEKWGSKLVIVANLPCRLKALCGDNVLPPDHSDLTRSRVMDYAFLEMIGRSRNFGVNNRGPKSLRNSLFKDSKIVFYRAKTLIEKGVINREYDDNGLRLILTRYSKPNANQQPESKYRPATEKAITIAKKHPNGLLMRSELKKPPFLEISKKLRASDAFKKCFRFVHVPYREAYPDASEEEYLAKNKKNTEKRVSCFKFLREEIDKDDSEEEDNCDPQIEKDLYMGVPLHNQIYREVLKADSQGISETALVNLFDVSRKTINLTLARLAKDKEVRSYPLAKGRQTTLLNVVCTNSSSKNAIERFQERHKSANAKPEVILLEEPLKSVNDKLKEIPTQEPKEKAEDESILLSARKTFRIGAVLRHIKSHRLLTLTQIYNLVLDEEKQQKVKFIMDRKTLKRILAKLVEDGLIKTHDDSGIHYFCDLSYDPNKSSDENFTVDHYIQKFLDESGMELKRLVPKKNSLPESTQLNKTALRSKTPKFLRLSVLHDVMFYLTRDYTGDTTSSHEELLERLDANCSIDEDIKKEMPRLYLDHVSCYMFTPPLSPIHEKTPGWCGLMEVAMNAPLSSMCAIISDRSMNLDLSHYLDHPIRQHYPVSKLPLEYRQHLLSLKTLYYLSCDVRRLCFMGLVKLGIRIKPRKLVGSSLYVNQRASIIDTTSSSTGYYHVEKKQDYPVTSYFFRVLHDVKIYWIDLFNICHQTHLGIGRSNEAAERELDQESLLASLETVTHEEAVEKDDGSIPGDHLGAGGLHSAMYSFMFSNWIADKKETTKSKRPKASPVAVHRRNLPKKRPLKTIRSARLDETDREALMQMNKMRVFWSATEDTILAMCKVGTSLLTQSTRAKIRVTSFDIRAALRRHAGPESLDKTQLAISRRIVYMSRKDRWPSLRVITQMTRRLPEAERFLSPFTNISELKQNSHEAKICQAKLSATFQELVDFLVDRYVENGMIVPLQEMTLPDTIEEFHKIYDLSEKTSKLTIKRIKEDCIRAVVLSSLSSTADKTSLVAQLLLVYKQFDTQLLRKAVKNLHRQHVIAVQRSHDRKKKTFLFGNASYHFSQRFSQLLNTKFSQSVFHNAYAELNRLLCCVNDSPIEMNLVSSGPAVFPLIALDLVTLSTCIPEHFVVLDTKVFPAESSSKIMKRYEELMNHPNPMSVLMDEEIPSKRMKLEVDDEQMDLDSEEVELQGRASKYSETPVGVNSARFALMILREIAIREVEPNRSIRKPIDLCVVSTSKIFIKPKLGELVREFGVSDGKAVKSILQTVHNRSNFLLRPIDEQSTLETLILHNQNNKDLARLLKIISSAGVKGSTRRELRKFGSDAGRLTRELEKANLILRTGVDDLRFVSRKNATPWSIKSYKLTRLEREKIHPKSLVMPLSLDSFYGQPDILQGNSALSESKSIQVIIRPWVRVDGSTNRRVLDRMLGSILGFVLCQPGIQCSAVIAKFSPVFSHVWIRELLDLLESIGCIKQFTFRRNKPTLFSNVNIEIIDQLDGLEDDDEILIEPKLDAIVKLGQFIGNKSYAKDMLT